MTARLKLALNLFGATLAAVGVVFVGLSLFRYGAQLSVSDLSRDFWLLLIALAGIYGGANLLLARSWWLLLGYMSQRIEWRDTIRIYGVSQLAKYVPGNIFQFAGRQALGMGHGLAPLPLVKSMGAEIVLIGIGGLLLSILVLPLWLPELSVPTVFLFAVFAAALVFFLLYRRWHRSVAWALALQLIFLSISGAIFVVLAMALPTEMAWSIAVVLTVFGGYTLAWLIGFVTPGSPAGVGVRELVLLGSFSGLFEQVDLLLAVLLARLVTVLGDILFFSAACSLRYQKN